MILGNVQGNATQKLVLETYFIYRFFSSFDNQSDLHCLHTGLIMSKVC